MLRLLSMTLLSAGLIACSSEPVPPTPVEPESDSGPQVRVLSEAQVIEGRPQARREEIAEILYRALQALDEDRLLTPPEDNAFDRFRRVLEMDPDNDIARQGLADIAQRYANLAQDAALQGLFDQAELFLSRARRVDPGHPALVAAVEILDSERESGDLFFDFEAEAIAARSQAVRDRLANVAFQAREHEAFFLITAPSDEQARWMYSVMREAVEGHRLRGSIEIAARYSVRLRLPEDDS